ncbi:MAG TPA: hypothetical protein VK541_17390 [Pedobacter sp.]|uniref:hypothetical protein n=1 Tax=Pedobacter sp. TaxID=1411316 RepID=UPI002BDEAB45|nr:hypothetical protein [Pedobacter sp.]HMI04266.1 hypothetical protein [Pedobacter sp.]
MATLAQIKNWFKTGLKPTQQQFSDTWDSFWHKSQTIPTTSIENLDGRFDDKADQDAFVNHVDDLDAHGITDRLQSLAATIPEISDHEVAPDKSWSSQQIVAYIGSYGDFHTTDEGQVTMLIPHGLAGVPTYWNVRGINAAAVSLGIAGESADATNIIITPVLTNNDHVDLIYLWNAKI